MSRVVLIAVDIRSTHNVGAFFRTCDGFGADLVLTGITPRPSGSTTDDRLPHIANKMDAALSKTALGAESTVKWRYFESAFQAIEHLQSAGYTIAAIEQSDMSKPIQQLDGGADIALLVGPEVTGLSEDILKLCDEIYEIPMIGKKESFNVSVAAGIALYQATTMLK